jgi:hypothetical protein
MSEGKCRFVRVTRTYMLDEAAAEKLVAVARALTADRAEDTEDPDIGILHLEPEEGDKLPVASAILEVPFPEALVGAELVESGSHELTAREVAEVTSHWPKNWADTRKQ